MPERDPHDVSYQRAYFGFCARDHMENVAPEDPLQLFLLRCDGCHNGEVQIRVGWDEGSVQASLFCRKCHRTERLPSGLIRCEA
jgi:hypothetical protein